MRIASISLKGNNLDSGGNTSGSLSTEIMHFIDKQKKIHSSLQTFKYWTKIYFYLEWWQFLQQWHLSTLGHTSHCYEQDDDESSPPRGEASSAWMVRCPDHSPTWWRACWTGGWNMVHWGWMRDCTLSWLWWLCYVLFTFISEKFIQNYFIIHLFLLKGKHSV